MRFVFRADASSKIGFGHLSRAAALAGAATRAGATVALVTYHPEPAVRALAERAGMVLHGIDASPGTPADALATRDLAGSDTYVIVDGYAFTARYLDDLAGDGRIVTYVDDLARERLSCDVVLNPNVSALDMRYETAPATELLRGPSFAIVHDRFIEARETRMARQSQQPAFAERVLVTMGGSDPPGATLRVLDGLALGGGPSMHVRVVVGAANQRALDIERAASACKRHQVELRTSIEDMAAEVLWADMTVTASGVTASEIACVGVPGVTFAIVDNQELIAQHLAALGMFEVLPSGGGTPTEIGRAVERLAADSNRRARMVATQRETIDGAGKDRVVAHLVALGSRGRHTRAHGGGERG